MSGDPELALLLAEVAAFSAPSLDDASALAPTLDGPGAIVVPLELETSQGRLSLISTTTIFGTPTEVTLSELAFEAFYPANDITAERLSRLQRA
jgi:hypothetical protein